jgi:hypothetical protein
MGVSTIWISLLMNNIPTGVQVFAVKANNCNNAVLQYCYDTGEMEIWWW